MHRHGPRTTAHSRARGLGGTSRTFPTVVRMSTSFALAGAASGGSLALDVVDPRPELRRAADLAAEAIAIVSRTAGIAWEGPASDGYRDLVVDAVHELYRTDLAADRAVGAAARYVRTLEAANAEASLR